MKTIARRLFCSAAAFVVLVSSVQAHPGHDDGHELTWELRHLAKHPGATFAWVAVFGALLAVMMWAARRSAEARIQSFRGSQPSRGN